MDIKKLTEILQRCAENESVDELLRASGYNDNNMPEGDTVKIKFAFSKENDGGVQVKLLRENIRIRDMTLDELEDYYKFVKEKFDYLKDREPKGPCDTLEYDEWVDEFLYYGDEMVDAEIFIKKLKQGNE